MKTIILGGGVIGIMSAYYLQKSGHQVTVIERQPDVALETSFANGGQISVCYSEPWSNFSNLKKMISWIGQEDSPILFRPTLDTNQWKWAAIFLKECFPSNNHNNIIKMLNISEYSRRCLQNLRKDLNLNYFQNEKGILTYYTNLKNFENAKKSSEFMIKYGCNRIIKNKEETYSIVPSLKNSPIEIFGSDYTIEDESGDAYAFTKLMKSKCEELGVKFIFNSQILNMKKNKRSNYIEYVQILNNEKQIENISADNFVCCLGSYSYQLMKNLNLYYPIYPAKGYSASFKIIKDDLISDISLTDSDKKIVFTKLGKILRVAGTAEFNGYNLSLNESRCNVLSKRTKELYPYGLDFSTVKFWTGLRPAVPSGVPFIEKTKINNLFINSGHGTLGWTMSCGSGKLISQIINKEELYKGN